MRSLVWIALAVAAAGSWLHDAVAQTGPAAQPPPGSSEPVFTPLNTRWTFPNPDAVNAGTVTIITAPAGGAKSVFAADMARVERHRHALSQERRHGSSGDRRT
jgi:hypothetical protein